MSRRPKGYADLADMPEDERIGIIGNAVMDRPGETIAVVTDSDPGKLERYVNKIVTRFPGIEVVDTMYGPAAEMVTVRLKKKE